MRATQSFGYLLLGIATVMALLDLLAGNEGGADKVMLCLLVFGASLVISERHRSE